MATEQPSFVILHHGAEGGGMDVIFGGIQLEPVDRFDSLGTFAANVRRPSSPAAPH